VTGAAWTDPADPLDLVGELERHELGQVLDRALGLLPPDTRNVVIASCIDELPCREIAARLAITEGAVSMRLSRGKRALRQLLTSELGEEALAFGLFDPTSDEWRETRLWCPTCGMRRLLMRRPPPPGAISFRCPGCAPPDVTTSDYRLSNRHFARLVGALRQPRRIVQRTAEGGYAYYQQALQERQAACTHCGRMLPLRVTSQASAQPQTTPDPEPVFYVACPSCREICSTSLAGLAGSHPAFQEFWGEQGRVRALPSVETNHAGRQAFVMRYESVGRHATLDIILERTSFEVLAAHRSSDTISI
jgi:hypothetical protein